MSSLPTVPIVVQISYLQTKDNYSENIFNV